MAEDEHDTRPVESQPSPALGVATASVPGAQGGGRVQPEPAEPDARSHAGRSSDSGLRARCFCTAAGAALSPPPQGYFIAPF